MQCKLLSKIRTDWSSLVLENVNDLISKSTVIWKERHYENPKEDVYQYVYLISTLMLVQQTALSIWPGHWTDNIWNNLNGDFNNKMFCVCCKANCSHINIHSYYDHITPHAPLSPLGSPAQIIRSVVIP